MNQNSFRWDWVGAIALALLVYACANRGYPEGGPKDTTPPVVVGEVPVSYTKNFDKKRVDIFFSEFVQLKEVSEKFVFSPPLKKNPKVSLRGKYVQVSIPDTLRPNTTYSMDFADAIVDNNEGNPLGYYRYVFSTGDIIDTLEVSGNVVNAESYEPMMNILVGLYEDQADSVPLLQLPDYIARTDSAGFFRLTNLRQAHYRVMAIDDKNKDKKYAPEVEMFGYLDSTVFPIVMPMVRTDTFRMIEQISGRDTITRDSIVTTEYLGYGPGNLYIRMFQEKLTQLYLVDSDRKDREKLDFIFSIPAENEFQARLWDTLATEPLPEDWYFKEQTVGKDTITLWIKDSTVYKRDTLNVILSYLRSDSTGQHTLYADTVHYSFKEKKDNESKGKKKKEDDHPKIEFCR
ncbi:MAG: Ig-like domain-containing protein [Odoribacter sp.]